MKPNFIREKNYLLDGKIIGYKVPQAKSLDIDSKFDFEIISYLLGIKFKK